MLFLTTQIEGSFSQDCSDLLDIWHGNFTYPSIWFGFQKSFLIKFWFYGYPRKHFQTHCKDKIKTRWKLFYGCWDALETFDVDKRKPCETIWCSTWLTCAFCSSWRSCLHFRKKTNLTVLVLKVVSTSIYFEEQSGLKV